MHFQKIDFSPFFQIYWVLYTWSSWFLKKSYWYPLTSIKSSFEFKLLGTWRLSFTVFLLKNSNRKYLHDNYRMSDKKILTSEKCTLWTQNLYQIKPLWYSWFDKKIRPICPTEKKLGFFYRRNFSQFCWILNFFH